MDAMVWQSSSSDEKFDSLDQPFGRSMPVLALRRVISNAHDGVDCACAHKRITFSCTLRAGRAHVSSLDSGDPIVERGPPEGHTAEHSAKLGNICGGRGIRVLFASIVWIGRDRTWVLYHSHPKVPFDQSVWCLRFYIFSGSLGFHSLGLSHNYPLSSNRSHDTMGVFSL